MTLSLDETFRGLWRGWIYFQCRSDMSHWVGGSKRRLWQAASRESPSTDVHVLECKQDSATHFWQILQCRSDRMWLPIINYKKQNCGCYSGCSPLTLFCIASSGESHVVWGSRVERHWGCQEPCEWVSKQTFPFLRWTFRWDHTLGQ